jgi:GNAT superfamily N-acetyltransferase
LLELQILAFMRLTWGDALFRGEDRFRDRLWDDPEATHFVRAAGDVLVSHAEVLMPPAKGSDGRSLRVAGVRAVLTYPQFRHEGHASAVVRRASEYIVESTADVGMLFTAPELGAFYEPLGWAHVNAGRVLVQDREPDDTVMFFGEASALPDVVRLDTQW